MKSFKIFDVLVIGLFIFGLAFALSHPISNKDAPIANNITHSESSEINTLI